MKDTGSCRDLSGCGILSRGHHPVFALYSVAHLRSPLPTEESMAISPEDRARLNAVLDKKLNALGISWGEVARRGGISRETIRAARNGQGAMTADTQRAIERGLELPTGTIARILADSPADRPRMQDSAELDVSESNLSDYDPEIYRALLAVRKVIGKQQWDRYVEDGLLNQLVAELLAERARRQGNAG
jgi:cyanate lyase